MTKVFLLLLFALSACRKEGSPPVTQSDQKINDSIMVWAKRAQDPALAMDIRKEWADKGLAAIPANAADSLKSQYYAELSLAYMILRDSTQFRLTNQLSRDLAISVSDSLRLAESHWDLAYYMDMTFAKDSAFYHFLEANKLYDKIGDPFMSARMLYNMATVQADVKDYTGSEITTIQAIEIFKPLKKNQQLYLCYNNLGSITKEMGEYDRALEYYEEALEYQRKIDSHTSQIQAVENNIGVLFQEKGDHGQALDYFNRVIASPNLRQENPRLYALALGNLAYSLDKVGSRDGLQAIYDESLAIFDSLAYVPGLSRTHYNLAHYHLGLQDTLMAKNHAESALEYGTQINNNKRLLETLALLATIDTENTALHTGNYIALDDSLEREERQIRNKFARIRFETDEIIAQTVLLERQRQLWIGIAAGVVLLALAIFVIIIQQIRNQKLRFQQQQQQANQEIFSLMLSQNQKMEEGKKAEQKRISEELHDGILGAMNGIRMVLLGLNKKADEAAIAMRSQALGKLQQVQEEIRTISHELNSASYQKFHNFIVSLQDLLGETAKATEIETSLEYDEDVDWDGLDAEIKINLYRILQESIQNSVKHSGADKISMNLQATTDELKVSLSDNGRGFDPKKGKKGIGHKNISSRLSKIRGRWSIRSVPGKGTSVEISIPRDNGLISESKAGKKLQEI